MTTVRPGESLGVVVMPPAGLKVLVPGYAQWSWGQRERGIVLFGTYAAAAAVGLFSWGTVTGLVILATAFGTHAASAVDAVRQSAFPGPRRGSTLLGVSMGLAVALYAPALAFASLVAWPGIRGGPAEGGYEGYLVNRWAYRRVEPRRDDWVWYRPAPWCEPRVGRVVAGRGQDVEWADNRLRIDGRSETVAAPLRSGLPPRELAYRVPDGHVLVTPERGAARRGESGGLVIVGRDQIVGRAWARLYPVRERQLLQ